MQNCCLETTQIASVMALNDQNIRGSAADPTRGVHSNLAFSRQTQPGGVLLAISPSWMSSLMFEILLLVATVCY